MGLSIAKPGDIVVCVKEVYDVTCNKKYKVLDVLDGVGCSYYTIVDDSGKMYSHVYQSNMFLSVDEFESTKNLN